MRYRWLGCLVSLCLFVGSCGSSTAQIARPTVRPPGTSTPVLPTATLQAGPTFTPSTSAAFTLPFVYRGHTNSVIAVAYSPDGSRIASGDDDAIVDVWNAHTGSLYFTYAGHYSIQGAGIGSLAWSPDGSRIASGGIDGTVQVWDAQTGQHLVTYSGQSRFIFGIAWSPDGTRIASGSDDGTVQIWDASTGQHLLTYAKHQAAVKEVAWSPNGKYIASAG